MHDTVLVRVLLRNSYMATHGRAGAEKRATSNALNGLKEKRVRTGGDEEVS
jgi:hypothetical protein